MKNYWGLVLFLLLFAGCHTSKRPVLYDLMGEESPASLSVMQRQYPDAAGVYLFYKRNISHDLKPDFTNNAPRWYFFESYHWREMILEDPDSTTSQPVIEFALAASEEIRAINYKITRPDGTVTTYRKSDLKKSNMPGDSTRFQILVESPPAGSVIEAAYEVERGDLYKNLPLSHDVALQLEKPAVRMDFAYTYPWQWDVQVKQIGDEQALELVETEDDRAETRTLQYTASVVPAFQQRRFGPHLKEIAPYFHVQVDRMEIGNVLVYEAPEAWEQVADHYGKYAGLDGKMQGQFAEKVEDLGIVQGAPRQQVIAAILHHVYDDIEVTRSGGVADVLKKQHGNSFAVAAYTRGLLQAAGISSAYLVAHSAEGGNFDDTFVTNEQLYHPVLELENGGYLFPVLANVPAGYIPSDYTGQPALAFTGEGFEGFRTIGYTSAAAYNDRNAFEVFVNADGEARVTAELELGHYAAYRFFEMAGEDDDTQEQIFRLLPHDADQVDELIYQVQRGSWDTPTRILAEYALEDCVTLDGEQVVLNTCGLFSAIQENETAATPPRSVTASGSMTTTRKSDVTIHYPAGWTLLTDVQEVAETMAGGRFTRTVETMSGRVDVAQEVVLEHNPQPAALAVQAALPAGANLPMLELTTKPMFADLGEEIEPGGPWTLVIQTYDSMQEAEEKANAYRDALADAGYNITVLLDGSAPGEFRLVLGTFATRSGIETAKESLGEAIPFDAWMLSLKPQMTAVSGGVTPVMH